MKLTYVVEYVNPDLSNDFHQILTFEHGDGIDPLLYALSHYLVRSILNNGYAVRVVRRAL